MGGRFEGCTAYIYDEDGNMLTTAKIYGHDKTENSIEISKFEMLSHNQRCKLFILSAPTPYACSGVVHPSGANLTIRMFKGKEAENRSSARYNITGKAIITAYICEEKKYALHQPIEADMLNISTTGVRFRARYNTLSQNDQFDFYLKIGDSLKILTAEVVNSRDNEREYSDYGCILKGEADE